MDVGDFIKSSRATWQDAPAAANEAAILALVAAVDVSLLPEYLELFRHCNGGEA